MESYKQHSNNIQDVSHSGERGDESELKSEAVQDEQKKNYNWKGRSWSKLKWVRE